MKKFEVIILPKGDILDIVHDLFIFQMYTGLPFSDMQDFDASDYKWDGKAWRHVGERIKTGVPYVSVLLPPVVDVLERHDWKVPQISNQKYNWLLKTFGSVIGIERMHSHLARHTFATYMLSKDVKVQNVMRMLGHKKIEQTMRYAKVLAKDVTSDFERVGYELTKKG
jgi:integrase